MSGREDQPHNLFGATGIETVPAPEDFRLLGTRPGGLRSEEAGERLMRHGPNALRTIRKRSLTRMFLSNFVHLMALLPAGHHAVRVIEVRREGIRQLLEDLPEGVVVQGAGTDPETLESAGIREVGVLAAVTGTH